MNDAAKLVYLMVEGEERGPFTPEQLRTFEETGLVSPDTMIKRSEEWLPFPTAIASPPPQATQPLARWFLKVRDELQGPFRFDQLQRMWQQGKIPPETRCKLSECWQPLAKAVERWRLAF